MAEPNLETIVIPRVFKHSGANYAMQNRIRACQAAGRSIPECAIELNLEPRCVTSFYEKFQPTVKEEWEDEVEPEPVKKPAPRKKAGAKKAA